MRRTINLKEALIKMDMITDFKYTLTDLYEACMLNEDDKKKLVKYIDAKDFKATNKLLTNKANIPDTAGDDDLPIAELGDIKAEVVEDFSMEEDTVKVKPGKWTNVGDTGKTHGTFRTKREADAQRKAMFARGFKESLDYEDLITLEYDNLEVSIETYPGNGPYGFNPPEWDEIQVEYGYDVPVREVVEVIGDNLDDKDSDTVEDMTDEEVYEYILNNFDRMFKKYKKDVLSYFERSAREKAELELAEETDEYGNFYEAFKLGSHDIQNAKVRNPYNYTIQELRIDNRNKTFERGNFTISRADKEFKNKKEYERFVKNLERNGYTEIPSDYKGIAKIEEKISETEPIKKGIAYKVFKVKNGKLYPPMVANKGGEDTPIGVWLDAEEGEFAGLSKTGRPQVKSTGSGNLSYRPGWHLGDVPRASQFDRRNKETGEMEFPKDFVWAKCEYAMDVDYQPESDARGYERTKVDKDGNVITYKSDKYQHSLAGVPHLPKDGYYKYRTNPNPNTVPWVITGKMKVLELLDDYQVNEILKKNGIAPIHRQGGDKTLKELGL